MKNKLKKIGKFIIHNAFGFLIGILIAGTTVYAATVISGSSISYDNSNSTLSATNVQDALDELTSKTYQCPASNGDLCTYDPKVGDYVQNYFPSNTSFTIPAALTGYTSDQTINPRELTLWRIIDIKNDGTIDMVSEYVSSTPVYFKGLVGYKNLVGMLNLIASQYTDGNCAVGTRHMGYDGQTAVISDTTYFKTTAPWNSNTSNNSNEKYGGGDIKYQKDANLVKAAVGTLRAYKNGTTEYASYWLASRYYEYQASDTYYWMGRAVFQDGATHTMFYGRPYYNNGTGSGLTGGSYSHYIRPIVTVKADIGVFPGSVVDGHTGTKDKPWALSGGC